MEILPLIQPDPPRLSQLGDDLRRVEASGLFSNFGPEARAFEAEATAALFDGRGATLTVANATLGLMIALRDAVDRAPLTGSAPRLALMPAMTFAATAQAAWWAGLTPLVCDVDPRDWAACARAEETAIARHGDAIAAILPYAAFGHAIDIDRYAALSARHGVAVVVDAAASLGTRDADGRAFGAGAPFPVVFSMHATKPFAVAEGGLIHCADAATIERLRAAANFGFTVPRTATLAGLNAKLPEVLALMARAKLATFDGEMAARETVAAAYRAAIGDRYAIQPAPTGAGRQALGFMPVLLPPGCDRAAVIAALAADGIGAGGYFSPHLGEHPWVRSVAQVMPTPVADDLSRRLLSLPLSARMTAADAARVIAALDRAVARPRLVAATSRRDPIAETLLIGGGPAGTAMLTAASRNGLLPVLAKGLVVVEAGPALGAGRLGGYAITSDTTADTFLTALRGNPHPEIAALADHPAARRIEQFRDRLGVPLHEAGPLLDVLGDRLAGLVAANGGAVLTGMQAIATRRGDDGLWRTRLRCVATGAESERLSHSVVIAAGGQQSLDRIVTARVAGAPLAMLADGRLVRSDAVLRLGGAAMVSDLLAERRAPRVAVIGGSTSAIASITTLLKTALPFGAGAITLLHREPLLPFYPSIEAARADGYDGAGPDDICPVSGFVHRLGGLRLESRELVLRMLGIGGRAPDPRVATHRIAGDDDAAARAIIRDADLVVAALGYRPVALPVERADGTPRLLAADRGRAMVDRHCRVLDADGAIVPGLYGIGLAAGFVPWGRLGGEASFRGQANGLWLWQNDVGMMIVEQLLAAREARDEPGVAIG